MKVFIFAGQSNAQGYGVRSELPLASSDSGVIYQLPTLANMPMLFTGNNGGLLANVYDVWGAYEGQWPTSASTFTVESNFGPEVSFLYKYMADHPGEDIAVIKCVLGGSSLENDWMPPDKNMWNIMSLMIDQAKARLEAASITYEFAGFIWMQGESGATGTYYYVHGFPEGTEYSDYLRTFLAAVRDMTSPTTPVIIGRISNSMEADRIIDPLVTGGDNTKANLIGAVEHRRDQQVLVAGDSNNTWWDNDDLPVLIDTVHPEWSYHFQSAGYLAMGERAYAAYNTLVNGSQVRHRLHGGMKITGGMSIR